MKIEFTLTLTGSRFFDSMILLRARELKKEFPGIEIREEKQGLLLCGELSEEEGNRLRDELDYYGTDN